MIFCMQFSPKKQGDYPPQSLRCGDRSPYPSQLRRLCMALATILSVFQYNAVTAMLWLTTC